MNDEILSIYYIIKWRNGIIKIVFFQDSKTGKINMQKNITSTITNQKLNPTEQLNIFLSSLGYLFIKL